MQGTIFLLILFTNNRTASSRLKEVSLEHCYYTILAHNRTPNPKLPVKLKKKTEFPSTMSLHWENKKKPPKTRIHMHNHKIEETKPKGKALWIPGFQRAKGLFATILCMTNEIKTRATTVRSYGEWPTRKKVFDVQRAKASAPNWENDRSRSPW